MELGLKDKVAIVTGGGRGIGETICLAFAKEGANVVVNDIVLEGARSVSEKINSQGGGNPFLLKLIYQNMRMWSS